MINSRNYKIDTPEWVMARFFECWKLRAWKQMLGLIQSSWSSQYKDPSKALRMMLGKFVSVEFVQMNANTGAVAVFLMNISKELYSVPIQSRLAVKLIREGKKWVVDPRSLI